VREEMKAGFEMARLDLDRLGSRWGIRSESVFRQTVAALLEKSFGAQVESRTINGEEFDIAEIDLDRIPEELLTLDVCGHYHRPDIFKLQVNSSRRVSN